MKKTKDISQFISTITQQIEKSYIESIKEKGFFTLVLSGGNTPKYIFEALAQDYKDCIDWTKVHIFWLDERCVPPTHKDSNYKLAYDYLLSKINHIGSIHRIKGEIDPIQAAKEYENDIKSFFKLQDGEIPKFDFILLGMGEDGHIASIFPESAELKTMDKLVVATNKSYNGYKRVTLTLPVINNSFSLLMINSSEKSNVFKSLRQLPVHMVNQDAVKVVEQI